MATPMENVRQAKLDIQITKNFTTKFLRLKDTNHLSDILNHLALEHNSTTQAN